MAVAVRRQAHTDRDGSWDDAPTPILVVEVLSGSTRRRDHVQKRELYLNAGVAEYWVIDPEGRNVRIVRAGNADEIAAERFTWAPKEMAESLVINVPALFG